MSKKIKIVVGIFALLLSLQAYSENYNPRGRKEQRIEQVEIQFELDRCVVDTLIGDNREQFAKLDNLLNQFQSDPRIEVTKVEINSYASPEGGHHYNEKLTNARSNSIYEYVTERLSLPDSLIVKSHSNIDWMGLERCVEESSMKYREEVLDILTDVPEETWRRRNPTDRWQTLVDSRSKHLKDLRGGRAYNYILENFYPQLRRGSIVTIYFRSIGEPMVQSIIEFKSDSLAPLRPKPLDAIEESKPLRFAVKTNLLYLPILIPSVEVEVPIGQRWSVAGEWIFPWWVTNDNANALQILSGQVEGRYWLGQRVDKPQLAGWFVGLYAGGGLYDLQWRDNGYQGEFYIAAGVSGGYAHTINKQGNLRMEYSLGVGYLNTDYRYYEGRQDNKYLVWQYDGRYSWIGPTKAKVSLVWMIDWKRGGAR